MSTFTIHEQCKSCGKFHTLDALPASDWEIQWDKAIEIVGPWNGNAAWYDLIMDEMSKTMLQTTSNEK